MRPRRSDFERFDGSYSVLIRSRPRVVLMRPELGALGLALTNYLGAPSVWGALRSRPGRPAFDGAAEGTRVFTLYTSIRETKRTKKKETKEKKARKN